MRDIIVDIICMYYLHTHTHTHARARARAHTHTHTHSLTHAQVDILLLTGGQGFVGHFSSNISRLVVALGTYLRAGELMPYVSLDIPWCWGGGRAIDIAGFGTWQC